MMHFDESMAILDAIEISNFRTKRVPLMQAQGHVLAEDIIADHNSPAYPTSGMDGYAFMHKDIDKGKLRISSINPAGSDDKNVVQDAECIKTFTGSLMPEGSDTLIPIENVDVEDGCIIIREEVPCGFAVRDVGENYYDGQMLIAKGSKIEFSEIGVLASLNIAHVDIYEKPRVAVLSTGSELLDLGEEQTNDSQIRSSNNYTIEAIVSSYGGDPIHYKCIHDDKETIFDAVSSAFEEHDIVVTTGGVSVGDFDFVKDVIYELDSEVILRGVRVKPGQHIMIARRGDKFIVGLPGFAYSATVMALVYVVPLIQKLQNSSFELAMVKATLKEPFIKRAKKAEYTACNVSLENGRYVVDFVGKKVGTSAILTNMLGSLGLLFTSEDDRSKEVGEEVMVVLL